MPLFTPDTPIRPEKTSGTRIPMRARSLPASVTRSLGVNLLKHLDAEAHKSTTTCAAFFQENGKENDNFMTPKHGQACPSLPAMGHKTSAEDEIFFAAPIPCRLLFPLDI
jgi:hypothetical protein